MNFNIQYIIKKNKCKKITRKKKKKKKKGYELLDGLKWVIFSKVHIKVIFEWMFFPFEHLY